MHVPERMRDFPIWNMPGSLDGVYFLGVGFDECVKMQAAYSAYRKLWSFAVAILPTNQEDTALLLWDRDELAQLRCLRKEQK